MNGQEAAKCYVSEKGGHLEEIDKLGCLKMLEGFLNGFRAQKRMCFKWKEMFLYCSVYQAPPLEGPF